ncbi:MmcQ/YjbR family DNA-binding protein [Raoultella ornithinolytica]
MARPKSEDKKQALLEAATAAFAQSGIAASTSAIARSAGVAEGTLFRYFATKDELLNELYLSIKSGLVKAMVSGLTPNEKRPKENARNIWDSYIDWSIRHPMEHKAIRRMALSERITDETRTRVREMFPELNEMCQLSVKPVFLSDAYSAFGDALFLSLAETTIEFASHDPQRARAHRIALSYPFTEHCWPFGPEYDVFKVGGRIFMLTMTLRGRALVNLKADPQKSLLNREIYRSIEPGYHMNKKHWITVVPGEDISEDLLAELIDDSWNQVVNKLTKKERIRLRPEGFSG